MVVPEPITRVAHINLYKKFKTVFTIQRHNSKAILLFSSLVKRAGILSVHSRLCNVVNDTAALQMAIYSKIS